MTRGSYTCLPSSPASEISATDNSRRRQLARIAPDSVPDVAQAIAILIEVGLFIDKGDSIAINSWSEWNDSRDEIEAMSKGGKMGNHVRWHVKKNVVDPACELCPNPPDSVPDSPPDRGPNPRLDTDVDVDVDAGRCISI